MRATGYRLAQASSFGRRFRGVRLGHLVAETHLRCLPLTVIHGRFAANSSTVSRYLPKSTGKHHLEGHYETHRRTGMPVSYQGYGNQMGVLRLWD